MHTRRQCAVQGALVACTDTAPATSWVLILVLEQPGKDGERPCKFRVEALGSFLLG